MFDYVLVLYEKLVAITRADGMSQSETMCVVPLCSPNLIFLPGFKFGQGGALNLVSIFNE